VRGEGFCDSKHSVYLTSGKNLNAPLAGKCRRPEITRTFHHFIIILLLLFDFVDVSRAKGNHGEI
jgi:hypothetical protein